jgi:hypothetical protein
MAKSVAGAAGLRMAAVHAGVATGVNSGDATIIVIDQASMVGTRDFSVDMNRLFRRVAR